MAKTPEASAHTSVQLRVNQAKKHQQPHCLMPFIGNEKQAQAKGLNVDVIDYLNLVNETGEVIRHDKRGSIESQVSILNRLGLDGDNWLTLTTEFEQHFSGAVGGEHMLRQFHDHHQKKRPHKTQKAKQLFGT